MAKAARSGLSVQKADLPIILGMIAREDRNHDIAAWFGLNQGRIKEVKDGKYGTPPIASASQLPPSGSPGIKARELRAEVRRVHKALKDGDSAAALARLEQAIEQFDKNE